MSDQPAATPTFVELGLPAPLPIYLDASLKVYDLVIPAGGGTHASVKLTLDRLAELCGNRWVDACVPPAE